MPTYPAQILDIIRNAEHASPSAGENAVGRDVNFSCACFVQMSADVDADDKGAVENVRFRSNGCGYMVAAAETVAGHLDGQPLTALHGLNDVELKQLIEIRIGNVEASREFCIGTVISASRKLFADHRSKRIKEFAGEKALVCTCFGISEESVENIIAARAGITVDEIATEFRAGSGCGSCRMLLQEMVDASA